MLRLQERLAQRNAEGRGAFAGARRFSGSMPAVPGNYADTRQISACHCEERSDVAIRTPCGSAKQEAILRANTEKCIRICPK